MLVRFHHDPREFYDLVEPFLLANEAENTQPLGLARSFVETATHDGLMFSVESGADVVCVAVKSPKRNLIVTRGPETAMRALAAYLDEVGFPVPGVIGPSAAVDAFCAAWTTLTTTACRQRMRLRLFALSPKSRPAATRDDVGGAFRLAGDADAPLLERWMRAFSEEALNDHNHDGLAARIRQMTDALNVGVWDDAGPKSMAAITRRVGRGAHVSWVYTPPELRGRGYASACVAELSRRELDAGRAFCTLYADLANASSNAIYERLGYAAICDAVDMVFVEAG